jgi:hypothetical protein
MFKAQYDLIPHKDDPFRYKELKVRGLVDENGMVAMGVQNALALIKAEEEKPKWQRKVLDFSRFARIQKPPPVLVIRNKGATMLHFKIL